MDSDDALNIAVLPGRPWGNRSVQDDEHEQEPKRSRRYDEKIDRRQASDVVLKECPPGLRWRLRVPGHVLGDSGLTDFDPKLEEFAMDARCAPQRVLPRIAPDGINRRDRSGGGPKQASRM